MAVLFLPCNPRGLNATVPGDALDPVEHPGLGEAAAVPDEVLTEPMVALDAGALVAALAMAGA